MLGLRTLTLENYRGIRRGTLDGLTEVNILIGRNNCGKSTILEAACRLIKGVDSSLHRDILGRDIDLSTPTFLYFENDKTVPVRASATLHSFPQDSDTQHMFGSFSYASVGNSRSVLEGFYSPNAPDARRFVGSTTRVVPIDLLNNSIEGSLWVKTLENRGDKLITSIVNDTFDIRAEGIQILPDREVRILFERFSLPIFTVGTGTQTVVRLLAVLVLMESGLLMIEEPECHQHPASLKKMAGAVCKLARQKEVQLLLTTHSLECLQAFFEGAKLAGSEAAAFYLELEGGDLDVRRLDHRSLEALDAAGIDPRFAYLYA